MGYLGRAGFRSDQPPREDQFGVDGRRIAYNGNHVATGSYQYNWARVPYASSPAQVSKERIPDWIVYLLADNRIVEVDLRRRSVRTVSDEPDLLAIGMADQALDLKPDEASGSAPFNFTLLRQHLCGRTLDRVLVFDREATAPRVYRLPAELQDKSFDFYELAGNRAMLAVSSKLGRSNGISD